MSIRQRSAKLATGQISTERPNPDIDSLFRELEDQLPAVVPSATSPISLSPSSELAEDPGQRDTLTERAAWQAFVMCLQMHFPEMAAEIDPAHRIGQIPPRLVRLSLESISFLNQFISSWYGGEVEIQTLIVAESDQEMPVSGSLCHVKPPYRPVTGLNVIVVPTIQRAIARQEKGILRIKERMCQAKGIQSLEIGRSLYAKEEWAAGTIKGKKEKKSNGKKRYLLFK